MEGNEAAKISAARGAELYASFTQQVHLAALADDLPIAFYAGFLAAVLGAMGKAMGMQVAEEVIDVCWPAVREEYEREVAGRTH